MGQANFLIHKNIDQTFLFNGNQITIPQEFSSYVMENVLFKISFPAEFHAQTAVEAAVKIHPEVINRLDEIEKIQRCFTVQYETP